MGRITVRGLVLSAFLFMIYGFLGLSPAQAEWYLSGYVGGTFLNNEDIKERGTVDGDPFNLTAKHVDLDSSIIFGGKIGHFFEGLPNFGLEVEAYHFSPDIDQQTVRITGTDAGEPVDERDVIPKADIGVTGIGINALYRLQLAQNAAFPKGRFHPYIGVGLGIFIAKVKTTLEIEDEETEEVIGRIKAEDTDTELGIQALAGLNYFLTKSLALFAEYKFIQTGDFEFRLSGFDPATDTTVRSKGTSDATSHFFYGGIAFHF